MRCVTSIARGPGTSSADRRGDARARRARAPSPRSARSAARKRRSNAANGGAPGPPAPARPARARPARPAGVQLLRQLLDEPRLADAGRPGERHEARPRRARASLTIACSRSSCALRPTKRVGLRIARRLLDQIVVVEQLALVIDALRPRAPPARARCGSLRTARRHRRRRAPQRDARTRQLDRATLAALRAGAIRDFRTRGNS